MENPLCPDGHMLLYAQACCEVSNALNLANTTQEVMSASLQALIDSGIILAGAIHAYDIETIRVVVGDLQELGKEYLEIAQDETSPSSSSLHIPGGNVLVRTFIPTRTEHAACLILLSREMLDSWFTESIAAQIAMGIDRQNLLDQSEELHIQAEKRIREVSTIYEIGRAMDSMEIGQLLDIITEKTSMVMEAQACSLMRLNPDMVTLRIMASYGLPEDIVLETERGVGEGLAGMVAQTGQPMLISDDTPDPRLTGIKLNPDIGTSMLVPLIDERDGVFGVLSIRRTAPPFDMSDLQLFSIIAGQAALAIKNKQLYDDVRKRFRELSTISDLTQAVISHLDLTSLLEHIADNIVEVVKFDRCCAYLLDRNTRRYVPRILRGYREEVIGLNPVHSGDGVVGLVARKQMPIIEYNARSAMQPMRGFGRTLGVSSFVAVPIITRGQTIGVIIADNKLSGRAITDENIELLTTFSNQAGIAIENAQLYEDREQKFQEMNRLATQTDNILRSIAGTVLVVNSFGHVTRWNKAAETMWTISEQQAIGQSYTDLMGSLGLPEEETASLCLQTQQVMDNAEPFQSYRMQLHPESKGECFFNVMISALINRQGERQGAVLIMEDVTREMHMEAEMARIRRLADIGQLAAKMAHEVRNPLSSIKGAAQLMRNEYEDLAPFREFLDIIIEEVNSLNRITTDLLDFARPMQVDAQEVDINEMAKRTLAFLGVMLVENHVEAVFVPDEKLPMIEGDPRQIEQVMRNIVINAVQAMPEGGALSMRTFYDREAEKVIIRFSDTGMGITPERISDIFQPFFTTKTKGTGLGLPIVRRILENHGGSVEVSSEVGTGTCFSIHFMLHLKAPITPEVLTNSPALPDT